MRKKRWIFLAVFIGYPLSIQSLPQKHEPLPLLSMDIKDVEKLQPDQGGIWLIPNTKDKIFRLELRSGVKNAVVFLPHDHGLYLIFDQPLKPSFIDLPGTKQIIDASEIVRCEKHLIIKLTVSPHLIPRLEEHQGKQFLVFYHVEKMRLSKVEPSAPTIKLTSFNFPSIAFEGITNSTAHMISFEDDCLYYFVFSKTPDGGFSKRITTPFYEIIPTHQGLCFKLYTKHIDLKIKSHEVIITPRIRSNFIESILDDKPLVSLLNVLDDDKIDEIYKVLKNHSPDIKKNNLIQAEIYEAFLNIQLNFANDALAILTNLEKDYPLLNFSPFFHFLKGMSFFLLNRFQDALDTWDLIAISTQEIESFKTLAKAKLGIETDPEDDIDYLCPLLQTYHLNLREKLIRTIFELSKTIGYLKPIKYIIEHVDLGPSNSMKTLSIMYQAHMFLEAKNYAIAEQMLDLMKTNIYKDQPNEMVNAYYEYMTVYAKLMQQFITPTEAYKQFDRIRLYWRNDTLEYKILCQMIDIQKNFKTYPQLLFLLQSLKKLYPLQSALELVDQIIQKTLFDYIEQSKEDRNPLKVIDTYKRFADYVPFDDRGHKILDLIAQQYERVGLLDNAGELLNQTLNSVTDQSKRLEWVFKIITIYQKNQQYEEIIGLLDGVSVDTTSIHLRDKIIIEKAKAYQAQGKLKEAFDLVKESTSPEQVLMQSHLLMQQEQWSKAVEVLETLLNRLDDKKPENHSVLKQLLNHLVFALVMDGHRKGSQQEPPPKNKQKKINENPQKKAQKEPLKSQKPQDLAKEIEHDFSKAPSKEFLKALEEMQKNANIHQNRLDFLRQKYGSFMQDSPWFLFLTRPQKIELSDLNAAKNMLDDAERLLDFANKQENPLF